MKRLITWIIGAVAFVVLSVEAAEFYTEWMWFEALGFEETFWTIFSTQYVVGFVYFAVYALVVGINVIVAARSQAVMVHTPSPFQQAVAAVARPLRWVVAGVLVFLGYALSSGPASNWMRIMQYLHSESFGQADAVFGNDIGFYIYELPFYQNVVDWLFTVLLLTAVAAAAVYLLKRVIAVTPQGLSMGLQARRHLMVLAALLFAVYAADYHYSAYRILFADNGIVVGASYTDVHARLLGYRVMTVISLLAAGGALFAAFRGSWKWLFGSLGALIGAAVLLMGVYPAIIEKFVVTPNALEKEKPFIEESIRQTRLAYDLERIKEVDFQYDLSLTARDLQENHLTIKNITLWDYRPIRDAYSQLQEIRPYYAFPDIDIDRYVIDNEYRQVMLAGREMDTRKLGAGETWINNTFIYTHGHGVVMSPVNKVSQEGQPEFFLKNIPTESTVDLRVERPEIYFGEVQGTDDYVIVKTGKAEFDYPLGEKNQEAFYREESGVGIGSFARKMLFAVRYRKFNILLNDYIQPQSRILYYRNISERVGRIVPFLRLDKDPYLVVENGRLYWIVDAYTTTDRHPYSQTSYDRPTNPFEARRGFNYIRNSVKVVVDAYNGSTTFYLFNPDRDPLIRVYARIFPGLFKPMESIPDYIQRHIRYPQDLFDIQAVLFAVYHVEDANVFFNREDVWTIAEEKYGDQPQRMESYYIIMKLPQEDREEFLLMLPFTPRNKSNMIAWFCARNDGENLGKLLVFKFPKSELVYGPMQVESRIDQTPDISEKLTLWNQQGSRVTRGNLLVIPIRNSVIYVEPLYLQSDQSRMPELKKVIVAYGNSIYMEDNLEIGLERLFGGGAVSTEVPFRGAAITTAASSGVDVLAVPKEALQAIRELSRSAMQNYQNAQDALRKGNWARYGEELEKLRRDLEKLVDQSKGL